MLYVELLQALVVDLRIMWRKGCQFDLQSLRLFLNPEPFIAMAVFLIQ